MHIERGKNPSSQTDGQKTNVDGQFSMSLDSFLAPPPLFFHTWLVRQTGMIKSAEKQLHTYSIYSGSLVFLSD